MSKFPKKRAQEWIVVGNPSLYALFEIEFIGLSRQYWWCEPCGHGVSYSSNRDLPRIQRMILKHFTLLHPRYLDLARISFIGNEKNTNGISNKKT